MSTCIVSRQPLITQQIGCSLDWNGTAEDYSYVTMLHRSSLFGNSFGAFTKLRDSVGGRKQEMGHHSMQACEGFPATNFNVRREVRAPGSDPEWRGRSRTDLGLRGNPAERVIPRNFSQDE